jgi:transcriptional/translational regulatory protein YebC/TACO1
MEEIPQDVKDVVEAKWTELDNVEHDIVKSYRSREDIQQALKSRQDMIKSRKLSMVSKTWATMSQTERKLIMGLEDEVTDEELGL